MEFSARNLFDGKRQMAASADAGEDPFRRLPDDLLRHVLSFLPWDDALQTCVLDTRWRDFWRRATILEFDCDDYGSKIEKCKRFKQIVNLIIQIRGNKPLVKCAINSYPDEKDVERLINYALMCQLKELIVRSHPWAVARLPYDAPFISQHLKILECFDVHFVGSSLDFSNCPALEDLKMDRCTIIARNISSTSLKRLCITGSCIFPLQSRIRIVAPGLISLQLGNFDGLTPSLGYMPFLVTAYVGLGYCCRDFCITNGQGCTKRNCVCHAYPVDEGVLLNGLSNAVSLELIAEYGMNLIVATGAEETIEQSFVCAHLKVVNIECEEVDEGVHKILTILRTCGILRDHISIEATSSPSYLFSFQKGPPLMGIKMCARL